jgi:hypothetical protein
MQRIGMGSNPDDVQVMQALGDVDAHVARMHLRSARDCAWRLATSTPSERIAILQRLVARITVAAESS